MDLSIESVVRKIERQFQDLNQGDEALTVDGVPIDRYLNHFAWDEAKHPHRRPLSEIISVIQSTMGKVEEELKQLSTSYSEKRQQLLQLQRKKGTNLMVANLDEVLTPDIVSASDFLNSDYLQTLVVIVPKYVVCRSLPSRLFNHLIRALEEQWNAEYVSLGDGIAELNPVGGKSSPVVPNSSRKLLDEGDSTVYTVTLLKGKYQPGYVDEEGTFEAGSMLSFVDEFKNRAREKRYDRV